MHHEADTVVDEDDNRDVRTWRSIRTGPRGSYDTNRRDARGFPLFVKATGLSDGWDGVDFAGESAQPAKIGSVEDAIPDAAIESEVVQGASRVILPSSGKAAASFYSLLPREESTDPGKVEPDSHAITRRSTEHPMAKGAISRSRRRGDWFIHKAAAQLEPSDSSGGGPSRIIDLRRNDDRCPICSVKLPSPLSVSVWDVHRSSIAHQLAADGLISDEQRLESTSGVEKRKETAQEAEIQGRIVLKPSNLGYTALQRMGWRKGLGLGRAEWEYGMSSQRKKTENHSAEVITISDDDDDQSGSDEEEEAKLEIGSQDWLMRVRQDEERVKAPEPRILAEGGPQPSSQLGQEGAEETIPRQRPLLEPIRVQRRPDRRGIGTSLPVTARVAKRQKSVQDTNRTNQIRLSKKQRREAEAAQREEWKQLRSSLN